MLKGGEARQRSSKRHIISGACMSRAAGPEEGWGVGGGVGGGEGGVDARKVTRKK